MNRKHERGIAIVLVVTGIAALIGMAGLALDVGHLGLNKARLQATVDAAALTAAKVLNGGQTKDDATIAAIGDGDPDTDNAGVFENDAANFPEMNQVLNDGDTETLKITVEYSPTLDPFDADSTDEAKFVRVVARNFDMWYSLSKVIGIDSMSTAARAVAGPLPIGSGNGAQICNVLPVLLCADPDAAEDPNWGFAPGDVIAAKLGAGTNSQANELGPGNYHLLRTPPYPPGQVSEPLAGGTETCVTVGGTPQVETAPGVKAGPVWKGINTRFGDYRGTQFTAATYPPDVIIEEVASLSCPTVRGAVNCATPSYNGASIDDSSTLNFNYARYETMLAEHDYYYDPIPDGIGVIERRNVALPVALCTPGAPGGGPATFTVEGYACMFLLQKVPMGDDNIIFGEITEACNVGGTPGTGPTAGPGPGYKIVLFNDAGSPDS